MKKIKEDMWNKTKHVGKIRQNRIDRVMKQMKLRKKENEQIMSTHLRVAGA